MNNTKILNLAEQAGFYIPQKPFLNNEQDQLDRINKFAQLIIDECMMAIHEKAFDQNVSNVFLWANDIVVTHFEDLDNG